MIGSADVFLPPRSKEIKEKKEEKRESPNIRCSKSKK